MIAMFGWLWATTKSFDSHISKNLLAHLFQSYIPYIIIRIAGLHAVYCVASIHLYDHDAQDIYFCNEEQHIRVSR